MEKGLVSVVVPVYNTEKYLDRCVESIANQTYRNLEILLIDDGSPDNCPRMCDAWARKDQRIRMIHKKNAGLGRARNTGIENANGEYICFFDSDDYVALDTIEKAYSKAKTDDADIVLFGLSNVNHRGEITQSFAPESEKSLFSGREVQDTLLPDLIDSRYSGAEIKCLCLSACACMFSMSLINQVKWRFVSERDLISEDGYSIIWLYKHVKKVSILPEPLYFYCENETSLTRTYRPDRFEKIRKFYVACMEMADQQGYCEDVRRSISGLFLSFTIAAMKQVAAGPTGFGTKNKMLNEIIVDDLLQRSLKDVEARHYGKARHLLFWAMRHRLFAVCYCLLKLQNLRKP